MDGTGKKDERETHGPGILRKLLLLFLSIPLFILLVEILLTFIPIDTYFENRFFLVNRALDYPEVFKKDSQVFWRLRSDRSISSRFFEGKEYHINSAGLRGPEIPAKSGLPRIIAVGNSCTFGWGIPDDQTYLYRLGALINGDSSMPKVETINGAVPGYSSFQGRRFFISDILPLKPDIVTIMFAWNDQWAAAGNISDKEQQMPSEIIFDIQNLFSRLKIYRLAKKAILSAIEKPLDEKLDKEHPIYRVSIPDFYDNLNVIVQQCRQEGITPVLLTSPIPPLEKYYSPGKQSMMHLYHQYYNHQIRSLARETKAALIDLAAEFDKFDNLFDDASRDPIHFNAKGHEVAAEIIYEYIRTHPEILGPHQLIDSK
ncbi:MAG: SGNH/GDSL hydrolase family protein [Candidatus Zixiibacteriota bacterium]